MILQNDTGTIVIVGGWNKMIFNKEWVGKYLFPNDDLLLEVNFSYPGSHRISNKKVRIEIFNDKIIFIPIVITSESYELIEELANKTIDYLPHTPANNYGINFIYENESSEVFPDILNGDFNIIKEGVPIQVKKSYAFNYNLGPKELNIILKETSEKKFIISFNYHYKLKILTDFKGSISEDSIDTLRLYSEDIIRNIFKFDITNIQG